MMVRNLELAAALAPNPAIAAALAQIRTQPLPQKPDSR
jgi:hypothetical protein